MLRIPRGGGIVRAFRYPRLDSLIWRSTDAAPAPETVLGFDQENGAIALVDQRGIPGWVDLHLGVVTAATKLKLSSITSSDGWAIFGVAPGNTIVRLTPSSDWKLSAGGSVRRLLPQPDGTLLFLLGGDADEGQLRRIRPPDDQVTDSAIVPIPQRSAGTAVGDRVYFAVKRDLVAFGSSDLKKIATVRAGDEILALAPTPSGDRVFLAARGETGISVVDRYSARVSGEVKLPGFVTELRMDPLGRFLLARPVSGDSAWVVAIGTNRVIGSIATAWRSDLPFIASDGSVAALRGNDVVFEDPLGQRPRLSAPGGAGDYWYMLLWNGFRPRSKGLDQPVVFHSGEAPRDSGKAAADSLPAPPAATADSSASAAPPREPPPDSTPRPAPRERGRDVWSVQFASVLTEERARAIANDIRVDGERVRVVVTHTDATPVYRVVSGPYPTRPDAERAGRSSGHSFWIIEGAL